MSAPVVVVAGAMAAKPGNGGEAWVRLAWVRGLEQLGYDVRFVEVADVPAAGPAADWFSAVTEWAGLAGRASLLGPEGTSLMGPDVSALTEVMLIRFAPLGSGCAAARLPPQHRRVPALVPR